MIRRLIRRLARREIAACVAAATELLVSRCYDLKQQIAALERSQRELLRIASARTAERDRARRMIERLPLSFRDAAIVEAALADEPGELSA